MFGKIGTYDATAVKVLLKGNELTGLDTSGQCIEFDAPDEQNELKKGSGGYLVQSKKPLQPVTLVLTFLPGSDSIFTLNSLMESGTTIETLEVLSGGLGYFLFSTGVVKSIKFGTLGNSAENTTVTLVFDNCQVGRSENH